VHGRAAHDAARELRLVDLIEVQAVDAQIARERRAETARAARRIEPDLLTPDRRAECVARFGNGILARSLCEGLRGEPSQRQQADRADQGFFPFFSLR
jgi:uncharacterized caspase-like protein